MHPDIQELISIFNFPFSIHVMTDDSLPQSEILLYQAEDGRTRIECRLEDETIWLTQAQIAELFQVTVPTVNEHLKGIWDEGELASGATIRSFRIVRTEGRREAARDIEHYRLEAILAVGYRVRSHRGTQFRQWAVTTACTSGPRCINVAATSSLGSCGFASWAPPNSSTGEHTGTLLIELDSTWATWSSQSLERTFAHELGHFMGLNNYTAACGVNDAAMQATFVCGPGATPSTTVSMNDDYLPAVNTVYGGKSKLSCGF